MEAVIGQVKLLEVEQACKWSWESKESLEKIKLASQTAPWRRNILDSLDTSWRHGATLLFTLWAPCQCKPNIHPLFHSLLVSTNSERWYLTAECSTLEESSLASTFWFPLVKTPLALRAVLSWLSAVGYDPPAPPKLFREAMRSDRNAPNLKRGECVEHVTHSHDKDSTETETWKENRLWRWYSSFIKSIFYHCNR